MARAQTFIIHRQGYEPAGPQSEVTRQTSVFARAGGTLRQTSIVHTDGDPPAISESDELDRWTVVFPEAASNRDQLRERLKALKMITRNGYASYTALTTDAQRSAFVLAAFDDVIRAVGLLAQLADEDYTNPGF